MTAAARQRLQPGALGELARDLDTAQRKQSTYDLLEFTATFALPLAVTYPRNPRAVALKRLRLDSDPEEPIGFLAGVHYSYRGGQILITGMDGPDEGERYRFVLEVVT